MLSTGVLAKGTGAAHCESGGLLDEGCNALPQNHERAVNAAPVCVQVHVSVYVCLCV